MRVVIQKVDLDTTLTAFLLGISEDDEIVAMHDQANPYDLADPNIICIECGGSGEASLSNFDHHDTSEDLPPACIQALQVLPNPDSAMRPLVNYVALLDTQGPKALRARSKLPEEAFPTLSDVFSGMLLVTSDPKEQLLRGIAILGTVLERRLDPFALMPELPQWCEYIEAKHQNDEAIRKALEDAQFFETKKGLKASFVKTNVIGALGSLYSKGCQLAVAFSPQFGSPPTPKYTIAGQGMRVDMLLPILNEKEAGWGGPAHGTILGSPRIGSKLLPEEVIELVREHL